MTNEDLGNSNNKVDRRIDVFGSPLYMAILFEKYLKIYAELENERDKLAIRIIRFPKDSSKLSDDEREIKNEYDSIWQKQSQIRSGIDKSLPFPYTMHKYPNTVDDVINRYLINTNNGKRELKSKINIYDILSDDFMDWFEKTTSKNLDSLDVVKYYLDKNNVLDKLDEAKKKSSGWSWFERVKGIPMGDETVPLQRFNNSVDFGALTADGGNVVTADSGAGAGMSVGEALDELNALDEIRQEYANQPKNIDELLVLYYKDILEKYKEIKANLRRLQKEKYALKNSGGKASNSTEGAIKRYKEQLKDLERRIDKNLDVNALIKTMERMGERDLRQEISREDLEYVRDYITRLERDSKKPMIGQRFKYRTYVPTIYAVKKVDDDFVYYSVEGKEYTETYPLEQFIKDKEEGTIHYVG